MKKNKKERKIGLNPEWFKIYLVMPIMVILLIIMTFFYSKNRYIDYIENKYEQESIAESKKSEQESIAESESYKRYLEESYELEIKKKAEIEKAERTKQQHLNTEYQNKIFSNYWKKGTYVYDKKNKRYGIVSHCQIPHVITLEGWYFVADESNDFKNSDIEMTGWLQWHNWTMKQLSKKGKEQSDKLKKIIEEEEQKREINAKKIFPKNPKYGYCKYDNEYYYILSWKNGVLKLRNRHEPVQNARYLYVEYDDPKIFKLEKGEMRKFFIKN